jgi:hypothetical protein
MPKKHSSSLKTNQDKTSDKKQFNIFYNNLFRLNPLNEKAENDFFTSLNINPDADKLRVLILMLSLNPSDDISPIIFAVKSKNCLNLLIEFLQIIDDQEVFHKFINCVDHNNNNALACYRTNTYYTKSFIKIHADFVNQLIIFGINPFKFNNQGQTPRQSFQQYFDNNLPIKEIIKIAEILYDEDHRFDNTQTDEDRKLQYQLKIDNLSEYERNLFIILKFGIGDFSYFDNELIKDSINAKKLFLKFVDPEFGSIFHRIKDEFHVTKLIYSFGNEDFKSGINLQNPYNGNTALHDLCNLVYFQEQLLAFVLLFKNGANLRIKNHEGEEPRLIIDCAKHHQTFNKLNLLFDDYKKKFTEIQNSTSLAWLDFPKFDNSLISEEENYSLTQEFPSSFFSNQDSLFEDDWFEKTLEASKKFNLGFEEHFNLQSSSRANIEESLGNLFDHAIQDDQTPQQDKEIQQDQLLNEEEISQRKIDDSINFNQHEMMVEEMNIEPSSDPQLTKSATRPLVLNSKKAITNLVD